LICSAGNNPRDNEGLIVGYISKGLDDITAFLSRVANKIFISTSRLTHRLEKLG